MTTAFWIEMGVIAALMAWVAFETWRTIRCIKKAVAGLNPHTANNTQADKKINENCLEVNNFSQEGGKK